MVNNRRIADHSALKPYDHIVVLNERNQMIGWIKEYFNGNKSNPDKYLKIEICEFTKDQLYGDIKTFYGYSEDILHNETIFNVKLSDHSQIVNQLNFNGLKTLNLTP